MNATTGGGVPVEVTVASRPNDEIRTLVAALDAELSPNYPPEQRHGLGLEAIFAPNIHFFVAYVRGHAAGCGGLALLEPHAEVKRMYVKPDMRGAGVADAIMARLEQETLASGRVRMRLETGTEQIAALRFYGRRGFVACGPFAPYDAMPARAIAASIFMEKLLFRT